MTDADPDARPDAAAARRVRDAVVAGVEAEVLAASGLHVLVGDAEARHRWVPDERADVWSATKGVSVLAVGIAVDEGLLTPGTRAVDLLPGAPAGPGTDAVTVEHLLSMTSGVDLEWFAGQPLPGPGDDLARSFLSRAAAGTGTAFLYSDASTYVATRVLAAVVGDVRDWLVPRLFAPLGIDEPEWARCPLGHVLGGSGLRLRTDELARVGRLLRDRGVHDGRRLVPAAWVDRMRGPGVRTGGGPPYERYGLGAWQGPGDRWRLDGHLGQYVVVDDARRAVVTITAREEHRDGRLLELAAAALDALGG